MASLHSVSRAGLIAAAFLGAACSPTFNWRDSPVDTQLTALMPCKPDRAQRQLPLAPGGAEATIAMVGCEAGGATFAVALWPALPAGDAQARLQGWQTATRAQWGGAQEQASAVAMTRAAALPPATQWQITRPDGQAQASIRWFAHADAQGQVTLYHAIVLGKPSAADAAATFFDGLRLR